MDRKKRIRAVKKNAKRHPMHTHSQSYSDVLAGFLASVAQVQPGGSGPWVDSHRFVLELFIAGNYCKHTKSKEKRMTEIDDSVAALRKTWF